ncbi:MAG: hypothetical protein M1830_007208 [Pleopsidium flavum]|nr:MAG: hypothetical protein M1830_007208 [Pleopsidium flavum]
MMDNKLHLAPTSKHLHNVLDVGTGTGIWAMDFADEHPSAKNSSLTTPEQIGRSDRSSTTFTAASFTVLLRNTVSFNKPMSTAPIFAAGRPQLIIDSSESCLKPGGWFEMQELAFPVQCDDNSLPKDSALLEWSTLMLDATTRIGQALNNPNNYEQWMKDAGFTNVQTVLYRWPGSPWPKKREDKELGLWVMMNLLDGLHGFTMALATRVLGWTVEQVERLLVDVRKDVQSKKIHTYWVIYDVYGQKPL